MFLYISEDYPLLPLKAIKAVTATYSCKQLLYLDLRSSIDNVGLHLPYKDRKTHCCPARL